MYKRKGGRLTFVVVGDLEWPHEVALWELVLDSGRDQLGGEEGLWLRAHCE